MSLYSHASVDPEKVRLAEAQYTVVSATFNRLLFRCREKCIQAEYGEGDLNTGELACTDRCVSKYVHANAQLGKQCQSIMKPNEMPEYQYVAKAMSR